MLPYKRMSPVQSSLFHFLLVARVCSCTYCILHIEISDSTKDYPAGLTGTLLN